MVSDPRLYNESLFVARGVKGERFLRIEGKQAQVIQNYENAGSSITELSSVSCKLVVVSEIKSFNILCTLCDLRCFRRNCTLNIYRQKSWQNIGVMAWLETKRNFRLQNGTLYVQKALGLPA